MRFLIPFLVFFSVLGCTNPVLKQQVDGSVKGEASVSSGPVVTAPVVVDASVPDATPASAPASVAPDATPAPAPTPDAAPASVPVSDASVGVLSDSTPTVE